MFHEYENSKI